MKAIIKCKGNTVVSIPHSAWWNVANNEEPYVRYNKRMKEIREYVEKAVGRKHVSFRIEFEQEDAIRYALNQGTSIVYNKDEGLTLPEEKGAQGCRYVMFDAVEYWMAKGGDDADRVRYAVISDLDLLDFDEWNATAAGTGIQKLSLFDAFTINRILYVNYDASPMDAPEFNVDNGAAKTVKSIFGIDEMTEKDEQTIFNVMKKYGTPCAVVSERSEAA